MSSPKQSAPRRLLPFALFAGVLVSTLGTLPERTYGDDVFFVWCIVRDRVFTPHFLYMPLARVWTRGLAEVGVDPFLALRLLAALGTSAGIALIAAACLRRGVRTGHALVLSLLVATASSTMFFARTAEIHGVQLAAVGLLFYTAAGLRPGSGPPRMLALALAFGLSVGAHKTSALLLPGVLCAYALATPGRAASLRLRDVAWFALGGALSLGVMAWLTRLESGSWFSDQESASYWTENFAAVSKNLAPARAAAFFGEAWITPAFAIGILGAAAFGALLRARPRAALALAVTLLPYAVILTLFAWDERGAYLIVVLPILLFAWAPLANQTALEGKERRRSWLALRWVSLIAAAGAVLPPRMLGADLGTYGPLVLVGVAFALGLVAAPRLRPGEALPEREHLPLTFIGVILVCVQLIGSVRELRAWSRETPLLDWGRDTARILGEGNVVVCTGFQQYFLLLLINRPWGEPYEGTWEYANELDNPGPTPFDVGFVAPKLVEGVERFLAEGRRVFVLETVLRHFEEDALRGPYVRALRERWDLRPMFEDSFEGYELVERAR